MSYRNQQLSDLLRELDLGSSVAESDNVLQIARIETSAFEDLLRDRVDLIPGTKGSGKSALFRIFVEFLPDILLGQQKVVVAHGVQAPGDPVFNVFKDRFSGLSEAEFVSFWCIYLVSLANEQFLKGIKYRKILADAGPEIKRFQQKCADARIPEIRGTKSLRDILEWSLNALSSWRPKVRYTPPGNVGDVEVDLFGNATDTRSAEPVRHSSSDPLPMYVNEIKNSLEDVLRICKLSLWLMVDRLDEIFPRRSDVERLALRGILRAVPHFASQNIRIKIFLRDDMLEQVVQGDEGFTNLTHVAARQADTLRWTEDQILELVVKRFFANDKLARYLEVDKNRLGASAQYRREAFGKVFPRTVFRGSRQSPTIRWIYSRCADGRGVVTPRDVLDLLIRAKQRQQDTYAADPDGTSEDVIGPSAIRYGFEELSKHKKDTYLQAEFPHLWQHIKKFADGKTDYGAEALQAVLGPKWKVIVDDLLAIGFFSKGNKAGKETFSIPFLYRHGLNLTRGRG